MSANLQKNTQESISLVITQYFQGSAHGTYAITALTLIAVLVLVLVFTYLVIQRRT